MAESGEQVAEQFDVQRIVIDDKNSRQNVLSSLVEQTLRCAAHKRQ
jgi:hypothetical protein